MEERSQGQRGCAIIMTRMSISLPNAHIRGKKKTMRRKISLTKVTRKKKIHKEEALWSSSCWSRM
jgi:hypothetical protein